MKKTEDFKIDVFIIGAQKSGSTSIFQYLKEHPKIVGHNQRECTFFHDSEYDKGSEFLIEKYYQKKTIPNDSIVIAKHVMEFSQTHGLKRIKEHNPNIKLILCLREPIQRAISAYAYAYNQGWETNKQVEEAFDLESSRLKESWRKNKSLGYVFNGLYGAHFENLLKIFEKKNLLVINYEDLKVSPHKTLQTILKFIGIEKHTFSLNEIHNPTNRTRSKLLARLIRKFLKSDSFLKKSLQTIIPKSKWLFLRNLIIDFNVSNKKSQKPIISAKLLKKLHNQFETDLRKLPEEYKNWFDMNKHEK